MVDGLLSLRCCRCGGCQNQPLLPLLSPPLLPRYSHNHHHYATFTTTLLPLLLLLPPRFLLLCLLPSLLLFVVIERKTVSEICFFSDQLISFQWSQSRSRVQDFLLTALETASSSVPTTANVLGTKSAVSPPVEGPSAPIPWPARGRFVALIKLC